MIKDFGLSIEGAGFKHTFDNEISSVNYTTSILMGDNISLDTLDITLQQTSFKDQNIYQYFRSLSRISSSDPKNLVATLSVGDYSTKFYNIADAQPAGISFKDITPPSFRMTTFPKKTAKSYDSMQAIYQQKSLFAIFKSVMKSNSIPEENVSIIGDDIVFADENETYNMFKSEGVSTLEFIRKLCLYYGYAIINRDNKITLINLIDIEKKEPTLTIDLENLKMVNGRIQGLPEGMISFMPKANLEPILEAVSIIKQDPILDTYKISSLKNPGVQNVTYQNKGGYITTKEFIPERTLLSRAKAIIREAQQKLRKINIVYSKIINIFAGDTVRIKCYENYFSKTYLVLETSHYADRKTMKTSMVLIENFNTADFEVEFNFEEING
jgi:hypothetical protein